VATGTPIANRPLDLFSQYLVMDKGRTFGTKFPAFKNTFCEIDVQKIQVGRRTIRIEKFLGVRNSEELRKRIMSTSLRRLKSEVLDLPPVLYKDFVVELRAEQRSMYAQMRDNLKVELANMSSDQVLAEASTIMVKLLRLSQIASNPCLLDPAYEGSNAKLSELDDLLEDVFADDSKKVIVWSHYVQNVHLLVQRFNEKFGEKCKAVGHTGEMDVEERQVSISAFQDDVDTRLFVATPQSAKEGLTLLPRDGRMKADTMIYLDLSFDAGSYVQSQARFHRIGQTAERCLVVHLVGETTVDEYIRKTVIEKIKTATELLDDGNPSNAAMLEVGGRLSKEELLKIL
jgi:SNF2 family DNA or RNA helicase